MKKRFTEAQIIGFLKKAEARVPARSCAAKTASVMPRSIRGERSTAGWRCPRLN